MTTCKVRGAPDLRLLVASANVSGIARVDVATLTQGLDDWLGQWAPPRQAGPRRTHRTTRLRMVKRHPAHYRAPAIDLHGDGKPVAELVVRVAPAPAMASFPADDFDLQAAVMRVIETSGLPVPTVLAVENDSGWLETPFW